MRIKFPKGKIFVLYEIYDLLVNGKSFPRETNCRIGNKSCTKETIIYRGKIVYIENNSLYKERSH